MKLDLNEILTHPGMRYAYPVEEPPLVDEDIECADAIRGELVFTNTGNVLLVKGGFATRVVLPCSRCLAYYEEPLAMQVEETFPLEIKPMAARGHQPIVTVEEEETIAEAGKLFDGPLLDLTEMIRQNVTLAVPARPLHSPDCQGMCAHCGANLNEAPCTCAPDTANKALGVLAKLLEDEKPAG
jgi:uncharacterized protein